MGKIFFFNWPTIGRRCLRLMYFAIERVRFFLFHNNVFENKTNGKTSASGFMKGSKGEGIFRNDNIPPNIVLYPHSNYSRLRRFPFIGFFVSGVCVIPLSPPPLPPNIDCYTWCARARPYVCCLYVCGTQSTK